MKISVPLEKTIRLSKEIEEVLNKGGCTLRTLSRVIGRMNSFNQAVMPGHLHFRSLEGFLQKELQKKSYDTFSSMTGKLLDDLRWWIHELPGFNGGHLIPPPPSLTITSDSSLGKWGAVCEGKMISYDWPSEFVAHINIKELKAAVLAFQCFVRKRFVSHTTIILQLDNWCAVQVINKLGSSRNEELNDLADELWHEAIAKNVFLKASYLPGKLNTEADWASRYFEDPGDWKLNSHQFEKVNARFGPLQLDLFASFHNHQLPDYFSWKPDPTAVAIDAFSQTWPSEGCYAFPPFSLISRVLKRIDAEGISLILIAPLWQQQSWFPLLLKLLCDKPRWMFQSQDLLQHPRGRVHPLLRQQHLHLMVWPLSGSKRRQQLYQKQLPSLWKGQSDHQQGKLITAVGQNGFIGVNQGRSIHAIPL
jgi:hypothetical protein